MHPLFPQVKTHVFQHFCPYGELPLRQHDLIQCTVALRLSRLLGCWSAVAFCSIGLFDSHIALRPLLGGLLGKWFAPLFPLHAGFSSVVDLALT